MSAQWFSTFAGMVDQGDWRLTVVTKSACPMVDQAFFYQQIGQIFSNCERWMANVLAEVIRTKPDIVVMGSALGYPFNPAEWEEGTFRILEEIATYTGNIFILRSTPVLPFDALSCAKNQAWQKSMFSFLGATEQDGVVFRDAQHLTDSFCRKIAAVVPKRMELSDFSSQMSRVP
jgi:hypothetical protein